ncbi:peptide deformylase [Acidaminobacter sp.]|uniref:peptide deformylase n=1 Tax=Acidaminobacter sp. TaxID=1872102 RepID=UPI001384399A|nr:peptide deformylase [Acidaminobacter sp.]MDK9709629.1 peptide deformylase [Acidaminobacter sp.]MZQ97850.1 peptide deformylase [Acidaminobacter sp.]
MAIRNIRTEGDEVLRKRSKEVAVIDQKIKDLVEDMIDTMYHAEGVGLAAPQVGILKRIAVIDVYDETGVKVLINPKIIREEGEQFEVEGCLSVPERAGSVRRPAKVWVEALNENGQTYVVEGEELLARALCHEIDHLDGVLFIDKLIEEA